MSQLTRTQFEVLEIFASGDRSFSPKQPEAGTGGLPAEKINGTVKELSRLGYIDDSEITPAGVSALEPYKVRRAVFFAAGFGSRMAPVTLNTPKPLVRVNGRRIIDGLIDSVLAAGINEIYIVRGYLSEQFDVLLNKYPMIKFIENTLYNTENNISSAMCARHLLENAYVLEADLLIDNPGIIRGYHYSSNFLGIKKRDSDDWCFTVENGIITSQTIGGHDCYQEVGISYWDQADGKKLSEHIKAVYDMPGGRERYWDQVPFSFFPEEYRVGIRECFDEDIVEIDTFEELKAIDRSYDV